jgi:hypothetical protein
MNNNKATSVFGRLAAPAFATLMLAAGQSQAASISYFIDQSNALPDGTNYLKVTVSDGAEGSIDFTVEALQPLLDIAGENFGIQAFALNVIPGGDAEGANVTNLPDGWIVRDHYRMAAYGFFDIKLYGGGQSRLDTLTFSIDGIDGDTPNDYAVLSTGNAADGHQFFAAKVAGFDFCPEGASPGSKKCVTSGFFGGSSTAAPVPLPAAAWLFATGFAGVLMRARKRS